MGNKTLIILVEHFKNILKTSLINNVIGVTSAWQNPPKKTFKHYNMLGYINLISFD
jgi:hypothetical protein